MSRTTTELLVKVCCHILVILTLIASSLCADCVCFEKIADSLRNPVHLVQVSAGSNFLLIAQQNGFIYEYAAPNRRQTLPFVNISGLIDYNMSHMDERGLLSFALHPNYETNGRVFVYYIKKILKKEFAVISEVRPGTKANNERILLLIEQLASRRNGGQLMFGRDRYLYISVGDGGTEIENRDDLAVLAQDLTSLLGKILRIDVDGVIVENNQIRYYTIPQDNPYVNDTSKRPEIYASGFRNAWRCSQDRGDDAGRIFCGDTGSHFEEEIDIIEKGGNYGWNLMEGFKVMQSGNKTFVPPIYTYPHPDDDPYRAVVGGYVYRGNDLKSLQGMYLYGDVMTGNISRLEENNGIFSSSDISVCPYAQCPCHARENPYGKYILSFGEDNSGEIYVLMIPKIIADNPSGIVLKLTPPGSETSVTCASVSVVEVPLLMILSLMTVIFSYTL